MDKFAKIKENLILSLLLLMLAFVIGELGHIYIRVMALQCKDILNLVLVSLLQIINAYQKKVYIRNKKINFELD